MKKIAVINGNYRYLLGREWNENKPQITFVMLNPSTADAYQDEINPKQAYIELAARELSKLGSEDLNRVIDLLKALQQPGDANK